MQQKYKHLFFDLDHTIWDFEKNAEEALSDLFSELLLEQKLQIPFIHFYEKYIYHNNILWDRYQKGFVTQEDLKWKRMWRTLLDFKIADETLAKTLSANFLEILPTKKNLFPYTNELLNYLKAKDYTLHLITNGFEKTQWSKLNHSNLQQYFKEVITSEASNTLKPKVEIFNYALEKAGANILESIMIGDNQDADIAGAKNAGMDTIFVNHINATIKVKPTFTVNNLKEIENIL